MHRPGESLTSPRRLAAIERHRRALELRTAGATFPEIAAALGYTGPGAAYKAVHAGIRAVLREPAEALVNLELVRLDKMWLAIWPAIARGNVHAIDRGLRVMERRARLLGLDAPWRLEHNGADGTPTTTNILAVLVGRPDGRELVQQLFAALPLGAGDAGGLGGLRLPDGGDVAVRMDAVAASDADQ